MSYMAHFSFKKNIPLLLCVFLFVCAIATSVRATESSSTSYVITNSAFDAGDRLDSTHFSVQGSMSQSSFGVWTSDALPLGPGTITSCGKITVPGTYTLNSSLSGISGPCFIVATSSVIINGAGHTITSASNNSNYAIMATSSTVNGGSGYSNLTIRNITFNDFGGGVNASGNSGTTNGGNAGSVTIATSTLGNIILNGGTASGGAGGTGGTVVMSGTDLDLASTTISVSGGSGNSIGATGSITVNGSALVSDGQLWNRDDSSWLGSRTYLFTDNSYNIGTTTGTTTFRDTAYNAGTVTGNEVLLTFTGIGNTVTISANSNFRGTGRVTGVVLDSGLASITTWRLINGSILTGVLTGNAVFDDTSRVGTNARITGDATFNDLSFNLGIVSGDSIFNDTSYNAGTTTNATFTATSFNSISGIPNADPTGISNGHTVTGNITFSATTTAVSFSLNTGSTWNANTSLWIFATSGQSWSFNLSDNIGTISGDAIFTSSQNHGHILGESTFNTNSFNAGTTGTTTFYNNSYNIGTSAVAGFHDTSENSHSTSPGTVILRCDFYDASLPGIGNCPVNGTFYHIPYYFNNAVSTDWGDLGNWWFNPAFTEPTSNLPQIGDTVFIGASLTSGPVSSIALGRINLATSTTGGGSFSVNLTGASGPAYFYGGSTNVGTVDGVFHIFGNRSFTSVNVSGTYTSDVDFHDGSWNDASLSGNAVFYDTSYNASGGTVGGSVEFSGANTNQGTIVGVVIVDAGASLANTGTILGNISNQGTITGGTFSTIVTNIAGAISGAVTNLFTMIFNGGSSVSSNGSLTGDAIFNDTSHNQGIVNGTSTFYDSSYNTGSTSQATFVGDLSENNHSGIDGIVYGIKTRLYDALNQQINLFRNFVDSPWTIVADNTLVKLLYATLVDIFGRDPNTTTTLVEQNGGFILRPLGTSTPMTSCGVLDVADATYTLGSDISDYLYDSCFIVRADGITLDGGGHSVTAHSSSTSLYAIIATTTLSVDATSSAFTNLTIKNITFTNFAHGLLGRGNDVVGGVGGDGASTTVTHTTIGDIDLSGGDPIEQAGRGGNLTLETSTTTAIIADGGSSTGCGIAGDGGNIRITTDSVYTSYSNSGGVVTGCTEEQVPHHGSSGSTVTNAISENTRAANAAAAAAAANTQNPAPANTKIYGAGEIYTVAIPVNQPKQITFKDLPVFGDGSTKGTFSLGGGVGAYVFGTLSTQFKILFGGDLIAYFKSVGLANDNDMFKLKANSLKLPATDQKVRGLFKLSVKGLPVKISGQAFESTPNIPIDTYLGTRDFKSFTQKVTLNPNMSFTIDLVPISEGPIKAVWAGKEVSFIGNHITLTTPAKPGTYILKTASSPLILQVEVPDKNQSLYVQKYAAARSWFTRLIDKLFTLF